VLDNLSAHKPPPVQRPLVRHPRVQFHFTPIYASWLNLVECFFGLLTEKALKTGIAHECAKLRAAIVAYVDAHNDSALSGVDNADDSQQHATIRPARAAGPWSMRPVILEVNDPGD
jgi:hypothetical protein